MLQSSSLIKMFYYKRFVIFSFEKYILRMYKIHVTNLKSVNTDERIFHCVARNLSNTFILME